MNGVWGEATKSKQSVTRGEKIFVPKVLRNIAERRSSTTNREQGRGRGFMLEKMANMNVETKLAKTNSKIESGFAKLAFTTNHEQGRGRGFILEKMANMNVETTPAKINSKIESGFAKCAFEETLRNIQSGFAKIDLINAFPEQRHIYENVITDLSTHKEDDPLFF